MLSFNKLNLAKQINFVTKCFKLIPKVAGERNNFGPSFYGMEKFNRHSEYISRREAANLESLRSSVQRCVEKPENKAFTDDIKSFLYLTQNDSDFQLLLKAVTKYHSQEASPIFNFRFGAPLMRLAHKLNKTNEMFDLYMKDEPNFLHTTVTPGFILMNKLFDERRYDDVLKVFNRLRKSLQAQPKDNDFFPFDALKLAAEANLEKNDEESVKYASEFLNLIKQTKPISNPSKLLTCLYLTAMQRGNVQLANDVFTHFESRQISSLVVNNLRVINLCLSNKVGDALNTFNTNTNTGDRKNQTFYFKTTLDTLKQAVEQSNNDSFRKGLDEVMSKVKSENLVARSDIKEYATRQVNYTLADKEKIRNERRANQTQSENQNNNAPDTFKSNRNRFNNENRTLGQDNMDRRPYQNRSRQQNQSDERSFDRQQQQTANNQQRSDSRTQTNSPKNRRQYLE